MNRDDSEITILESRDPLYGSSRFTTDFIMELEANIDRSKWKNRREFFLQTLSFCLSLPNFLRLPKSALTNGQGAFVWLYIFSTTIIGTALIFFELALGQYSSKGFHKVFAMCPLFEGIGYAMVSYCAIVSVYYNILNTYSFVYLFASFNDTLEYSTCGDAPADICNKSAVNQTLSPEHVYFNHRIVYYTFFNNPYGGNGLYSPNWRNVGVLFFLWTMTCIVILQGIRTVKWPPKLLCPVPYIVFAIILTVALTMNGAKTGLKAMFSVTSEQLFQFSTFRSAIEQSIVSVGIGMGPLITLGSYSKFRSPADRDGLFLCVCSLISSLLIGSILFCAVGILASERNQTMTTALVTDARYPDDLSVYVIFSQLFSRMPEGVSHLMSFIFFLTLFLTGWYSLITYTETVIVSAYMFYDFSHKHKVYTNLGVCMLFYIAGVGLASRAGYHLMLALDRIIVMIGLFVIVFCELCAVIYTYGLHNFCDDIDFLLGFYPNLFYQVLWAFTPLVLIICFIQFLCTLVGTEKIAVYIVVIAIVLPIILVGVYNVYRCYKLGSVKYVFSPLQVILLEDDSTSISSHMRSSHYRSTAKAVETAGSSHLNSPKDKSMVSTE